MNKYSWKIFWVDTESKYILLDSRLDFHYVLVPVIRSSGKMAKL